MEIERKFLIDKADLPDDYASYPSHELKQGYILHSPALRIRKTSQDGGESTYTLTYKDKGGLARQEINIDLPAEAGEKLFTKCEGHVIDKTRYLIPAGVSDPTSGRALTIELDVFHGEFKRLIYAEVEFDSEETAKAYEPPKWFGKDLTGIRGFSNSELSKYGMPAACR